MLSTDSMVFGLLRSLFVWTVLLILLLVFAPGLPPHGVQFADLPSPDPVKLEGPLAPNDRLDAAELLSDQIDTSSLGYLKVNGAEHSIVFYM